MFPKNDLSADGKWTPFMKLCLLKVLRPERLPQAIKDFISVSMGDKFLTPPVFDLEESFNDSSVSTPLIFVMPGNDPMNNLEALKMAKKKKMFTCSLG